MATIQVEKRSRILEAAHTRFLHYGISKTTMRDIADALEMAVSNLYLYFKNKREIVLAIAEECRAAQEKTTQAIFEDTAMTSGQKLETFLLGKFRCINTFRNDSPHGKELIAYLIQEFPERPALWQQYLEQTIQVILEQGIAQGEFEIDDPKPLASLLRIATVQFFIPVHIELPNPPTEEELIQVVRWFLSLYSRHFSGLPKTRE